MIEIHAQTEAKVEYIFTQTKDDTEYHLIQAAHKAANAGNWVVGECAARWLANYGKGKTDGTFAELIELSEEKVYQCRRVWERFGRIANSFKIVSWSHFREAVNWENAEECLEWAEDCNATVNEMRAWQRSQTGTLKDHGNKSVPFTGKEKPENTPPSAKPPNSRVTPPEKRNTNGGGNAGSKSTESGKVETAPSAVSQQAPTRSAVATETQTVQEAIRQIESLAQFVLDHGTEIEREALFKRLKPVVVGLDPERPTPRNAQSVAASLAVANAVVREWNMIDGITQCRSVTPKRRSAIGARWKEPFWKENWQKALEIVKRLPALHGKNDREWIADIDWFIRPDTVAKLIEGKYETWKPSTTKAAARSQNNKRVFDQYFGRDDRATDEDAVF